MQPPSARLPMLNAAWKDIALNRFPLKHGWDALALAQVLLKQSAPLSNKAKCLQFYLRTGNIRNLYATLPRSGSHWSILGLEIALDLQAGGDGDYQMLDNSWQLPSGKHYTKLDWRVPLGTIDKDLGGEIVNPLIYHSHHPYYRIRSAQLKNMKIVVLLRDIVESMESKFYKLSSTPDVPTMDDDSVFEWGSTLRDDIEFYNSWGDVMKWHRNIRVFRYKDLLNAPVDAHKEITDFWGLSIPRELLQEAFSRITKDKMREKIVAADAANTQQRVSYRNRSKPSNLPPHRIEEIKNVLRHRLVYNFGNDLA